MLQTGAKTNVGEAEGTDAVYRMGVRPVGLKRLLLRGVMHPQQVELLPSQRTVQGAVNQQAATEVSRAIADLAATMCRSVIHRLCLGLPCIVACSSLHSLLLIVLPAIPATSSMLQPQLPRHCGWMCRRGRQKASNQQHVQNKVVDVGKVILAC